MEKTEAIECGNTICGSCAPAVTGPSQTPARTEAPAGAITFRIQTMDCAVEESEIRRALEPLAGIQGLNFQLGARTLAITAPESVVEQAVEAIRRVGFEPKPLATSARANTVQFVIPAKAGIHPRHSTGFPLPRE